MDLEDPQGLSFDHLTGLTRLRLSSVYEGEMDADLPGVSFAALRQLRQLELQGMWVDDQTLLDHQEQLVGLELGQVCTVLDQLTHLQRLRLLTRDQVRVEQLLQQAPPLKQLYLELEGTGTWSSPWQLQQYQGLAGLEALGLEWWCYGPPPAAPLGMFALTQLKQLRLEMHQCTAQDTAPLVSWVYALAGLVNLELLSLPGVLTDCYQPWLTGLTRLVVLEVSGSNKIGDMPAAAAHISQLLAPTPASSNTAKMRRATTGQVRLVCIKYYSLEPELAAAVQLHKALVAAVPVLRPNMHLFRGDWQQLQQCGVELWPEPVAARLQQLVLR
jgi:hypothetical protein